MHGYLAHSDPGIIQDFLLFGQNRSKIMHIFIFKSRTEQKRFSSLICSIGICERKGNVGLEEEEERDVSLLGLKPG